MATGFVVPSFSATDISARARVHVREFADELRRQGKVGARFRRGSTPDGTGPRPYPNLIFADALFPHCIISVGRLLNLRASRLKC